MFLKPEDLENVRVSSLLSLAANSGLGLVSTSQTSEETQWNSNDLGVVRVREGTHRYHHHHHTHEDLHEFMTISQLNSSWNQKTFR
jgi:hypothetical protein